MKSYKSQGRSGRIVDEERMLYTSSERQLKSNTANVEEPRNTTMRPVLVTA
jgi:hypothetical protein